MRVGMDAIKLDLPPRLFMADLKQAWQASLEAEEKFKTILQRFL